jgi:POT family proton-dependent oligopeptide transporter
MYDAPQYSSKRDSGFQIFYVFINIGGLIAPFVAPVLRGWWLGKHSLVYNADLPALCHAYIEKGMGAEQLNNLNELAAKVSGTGFTDLAAFCTQYLDVFNTGVHYSFIASVVAMLLSLVIFIFSKKMFPNPVKKETEIITYTPEEKIKMAQEIKQRILALFAVLGVVVFFWFSFHQNGASLSFFARDFVVTSVIPPEIWQAINPFFVIVLTPLIMLIFNVLSKRGKEISTPKKIAVGMGVAGVAFLFLSIISNMNGYPAATEFRGMAETAKEGLKSGPWVLIVLYFFLTVAELFISPLGLSFVSKVAPKNLQGLCQGLWLAATAVGNGLLWLGPWMYNKFPIWQCWLVFVILCVFSMLLMLSMIKWIERVAK